VNAPTRAPSAAPGAPRPLRQAATIILMRDGVDAPEVLLLRRVERSDDRSSGAWVFPGGTLDAEDRELHALCAGLDDAAASRRLALPQGGLDLYAAAIRECFEEAGLLLARGPDGALLADGPRVRALRETHVDLGGTCAQLGARLAADRLVYCAHWITPLGVPKRFDTRFFIAEAPPGQEVLPALHEVSDYRWLPVAEALADAQSYHLVPVTRRVLQSLAGFATVRECLAHFAQLAHVPTVLPRRGTGAAGVRAVMPWDAAYAEISHLDPEGRGDSWAELRPFEPVWLFDWLCRVPSEQANGYLLRLPSGECAVLDPAPGSASQHAALRAAAGGSIRWVVSTAVERDASATAFAGQHNAEFLRAAGRDRLVLGANSVLRVLDATVAGRRGLLSMDGQVLFTGEGGANDAEAAAWNAALLGAARAAGAAPHWLAPGRGFLVRASAQGAAA